MNIKENLNNNQLEAVNVKEGPCLVIAGAGSGKTYSLVESLKYLILHLKFLLSCCYFFNPTKFVDNKILSYYKYTMLFAV